MNGETERVDFEDDGKPPTIVSGLEDIRVRKTVDLNVVTDCLAHWTCAEAFREIYQNWSCSLEDAMDTRSANR